MNLDKYINQDIFNPDFLFHGSPYDLDVLKPHQSNDSYNENNKDNAIFLTSNFLSAIGYAFRNGLKLINEHWNFELNNEGKLPVMKFEVDNLPDDFYGYVYVFNKEEDIIKDNFDGTTQYRCYHELKPINKIKVYYKDFEQYFDRNKGEHVWK